MNNVYLIMCLCKCFSINKYTYIFMYINVTSVMSLMLSLLSLYPLQPYSLMILWYLLACLLLISDYWLPKVCPLYILVITNCFILTSTPRATAVSFPILVIQWTPRKRWARMQQGPVLVESGLHLYLAITC